MVRGRVREGRGLPVSISIVDRAEAEFHMLKGGGGAKTQQPGRIGESRVQTRTGTGGGPDQNKTAAAPPEWK